MDKTSAAIAAYADELVIPTYKMMSDNALKFAKAAKELKAAPTDAKVAEAGKLLLETRVPWELSESFLFGPAAFANLDPKLDSWPLDTTNLDAVAKNADSKSVTIDAADCESLYSYTSLVDSRHNVQSVEKSYNVISPLVAAKSAKVDQAVKGSIAKVFKSLDAIQGPLVKNLDKRSSSRQSSTVARNFPKTSTRFRNFL